jgi:hypothetical protein
VVEVSWDAYLTDDRGHTEGDWNYTHNCNRMIGDAMATAGYPEVKQCAGPLGPAIGPAWWDRLDGLSGPEGAALLDHIIRALEAEPARFIAMNPDNGWGDYDSLVKVLCDMRDAVPEWPTTWSVSG